MNPLLLEKHFYWGSFMNRCGLCLLTVFTLLQSPVWAATPTQELLQAMAKGNSQQVIQSIEQGANVNIVFTTKQRQMTPLFWAATYGNLKLIRLLLAKGAQPKDPLLWVVLLGSGHPEDQDLLGTVKLLHDHHLPLEQPDQQISLLHMACEQHQWILAKFALQLGANPNVTGSFEFTPLHWAASAGELDMVQLLLRHGAKIDACDGFGFNALGTAANTGQTEVVKFLRAQGAKPITLIEANQQTELMQAAASGDMDWVKSLLTQEPQLAGADQAGFTPLSYASRNGKLDVMALLLEKGANVEQPDEAGLTVLAYALDENRLNVAEWLISKGASVNVQDNHDGYSPLMKAVMYGELKMIQLILKAGAKRDLKSKEGKTALDYLAQRNDTAENKAHIQQWLLQK